MRHLEWLVQLCFLLHVIKIIETYGGMLSKETIFQLKKHPAAYRNDADVIKNISKIFYDYNHTANETDNRNTCNSTYKNSNPVELFKFSEQIVRKETVDESDKNVLQFAVKQPKEENHRSQYEVQPFSILHQLRLDEQQQQQQNQQQLAHTQQQNVFELQHIMHKLDTETLSKAAKKKKKKKGKKKKPAKKKKRKKNKQKPTNHQTSLIAQPAHILFASPAQKPLHYYHHQQHDHQAIATTKHPFKPLKKFKYFLRKNTIFKKKKKEYLNHLKQVLYPFVKFIAFFTVINPFTLSVFLFSLISPVFFGFLGFIGLSFLIKPALNLLFGIKHAVNTIKRRKLKELRRRQRLRDRRRPITIHKHYYQQLPIKPPPAAPHHHYPHPVTPKLKAPFHHSFRLGNHRHHTRKMKLFNPLLPDMSQILKKDKYIFPDIKGYNDSFEQF